MIKQRNEPVIDVTLSYADIELILTSLEHYVPRTQHATQQDTIELLSLMNRYERRLFKLRAEAVK
jgi:hypothetical protein